MLSLCVFKSIRQTYCCLPIGNAKYALLFDIRYCGLEFWVQDFILFYYHKNKCSGKIQAITVKMLWSPTTHSKVKALPRCRSGLTDYSLYEIHYPYYSYTIQTPPIICCLGESVDCAQKGDRAFYQLKQPPLDTAGHSGPARPPYQHTDMARITRPQWLLGVMLI